MSPYLVDTMEVGDGLELRGPIGGWFRWTEQIVDPVLLVGGGSGITPLMAMLRRRVRGDSVAPFHLVYSARTPDHVFFANELYSISQGGRGVTVDLLYTRSGLPDDPRHPGRLNGDDLPAAVPGDDSTRVYVCGPNGFVENASRLLLARRYSPASIRTERFGPSGG